MDKGMRRTDFSLGVNLSHDPPEFLLQKPELCEKVGK